MLEQLLTLNTGNSQSNSLTTDINNQGDDTEGFVSTLNQLLFSANKAEEQTAEKKNIIKSQNLITSAIIQLQNTSFDNDFEEKNDIKTPFLDEKNVSFEAEISLFDAGISHPNAENDPLNTTSNTVNMAGTANDSAIFLSNSPQNDIKITEKVAFSAEKEAFEPQNSELFLSDSDILDENTIEFDEKATENSQIYSSSDTNNVYNETELADFLHIQNALPLNTINKPEKTSEISEITTVSVVQNEASNNTQNPSTSVNFQPNSMATTPLSSDPQKQPANPYEIPINIALQPNEQVEKNIDYITQNSGSIQHTHTSVINDIQPSHTPESTVQKGEQFNTNSFANQTSNYKENSNTSRIDISGIKTLEKSLNYVENNSDKAIQNNNLEPHNKMAQPDKFSQAFNEFSKSIANLDGTAGNNFSSQDITNIPSAYRTDAINNLSNNNQQSSSNISGLNAENAIESKVTNQILAHVSSTQMKSGTEVKFKLFPEELGSIEIKFSENANSGKIIVELSTQKTATFDIIQKLEHEILDIFKNNEAFKNKSVEINLGMQSSKNNSNNNDAQNQNFSSSETNIQDDKITRHVNIITNDEIDIRV